MSLQLVSFTITFTFLYWHNDTLILYIAFSSLLYRESIALVNVQPTSTVIGQYFTQPSMVYNIDERIGRESKVSIMFPNMFADVTNMQQNSAMSSGLLSLGSGIFKNLSCLVLRMYSAFFFFLITIQAKNIGEILKTT